MFRIRKILPIAPTLAATLLAAAEPCPPDAAPEQTARDLIAADNLGDLDQVVALYSEDVVLLPPTSEVVEGRAAIRERYAAMFAAFRPQLEIVIVEASGAGTLAFVRGTTRGWLHPRGAGTPTRVHDNLLMLLRCQRGTWKVSHLMWSHVAGPPDPPDAGAGAPSVPEE